MCADPHQTCADPHRGGANPHSAAAHRRESSPEWCGSGAELRGSCPVRAGSSPVYDGSSPELGGSSQVHCGSAHFHGGSAHLHCGSAHRHAKAADIHARPPSELTISHHQLARRFDLYATAQRPPALFARQRDSIDYHPLRCRTTEPSTMKITSSAMLVLKSAMRSIARLIDSTSITACVDSTCFGISAWAQLNNSFCNAST